MSEEYPKQEFFVHCAKCGHDWLVAVIPMDLDRFVVKLEAAVKGGCPKCDGRKVFLGRKPDDEGKQDDQAGERPDAAG